MKMNIHRIDDHPRTGLLESYLSEVGAGGIIKFKPNYIEAFLIKGSRDTASNHLYAQLLNLILITR